MSIKESGNLSIEFDPPAKRLQSDFARSCFMASSLCAIGFLIARGEGLIENDFLKWHGSNLFDGMMAASFLDRARMDWKADESKPAIAAGFAMAVAAGWEYFTAHKYAAVLERPIQFDWTDLYIVCASALTYGFAALHNKNQSTATTTPAPTPPPTTLSRSPE